MVQAGGLGIDEVFLMAREAHRRQSLELADRRALVAGIAIQRGVRADQREAIHVLIDLLNGNVPAPHGMALLAVRSHLALVDISVTVRALGSYIREHQLGVALRAAHALVHTPQRVFCGVVIKFGHRPDRLPAAQRVAVLTGNAQTTVRTARVCGRLRLSGS